MVVWIVGLSGSGKTTIGTQLYKQWQKVDPRVVFLDGDEVRRVFTVARKHQDYSISGREQNAQRLVRLCELLDQQGFNVVVSILCIFPKILASNRINFSSYFEVFLNAPLSELRDCDEKRVYSGHTKNVVGIDIPFPIPERPDVIIENRHPFELPSIIGANLLAMVLNTGR